METQTISNKYIDEDALDKVLSELFGNDFQYIVSTSLQHCQNDPYTIRSTTKTLS